jgi:hypothetical protein
MPKDNGKEDASTSNASTNNLDPKEAEQLEVEAVERVVNAMLYYQKHATFKLKRKAETIV